MTKKANKIGRILLISLALLGIIVMGYLTSLHYSSEQDLVCDLGQGFSCDIVNKSSYASILGISVSILGLLYFIAVLVLSIFRYSKLSLKRIILISILALGPSLYLTLIEIFVLKNICVVCETAKVIMIGVILVSLFALRPEKFGLQGFVIAIILAVLLGAAMYFVQLN